MVSWNLCVLNVIPDRVSLYLLVPGSNNWCKAEGPWRGAVSAQVSETRKLLEGAKENTRWGAKRWNRHSGKTWWIFQREGDQAPNKIPADIVFIIKDKPHPHFRREGSDLKYTCRLTLKEVGQLFLLSHSLLILRWLKSTSVWNQSRFEGVTQYSF